MFIKWINKQHASRVTSSKLFDYFFRPDINVVMVIQDHKLFSHCCPIVLPSTMFVSSSILMDGLRLTTGVCLWIA